MAAAEHTGERRRQRWCCHRHTRRLPLSRRRRLPLCSKRIMIGASLGVQVASVSPTVSTVSSVSIPIAVAPPPPSPPPPPAAAGAPAVAIAVASAVGALCGGALLLIWGAPASGAAASASALGGRQRPPSATAWVSGCGRSSWVTSYTTATSSTAAVTRAQTSKARDGPSGGFTRYLLASFSGASYHAPPPPAASAGVELQPNGSLARGVPPHPLPTTATTATGGGAHVVSWDEIAIGAELGTGSFEYTRPRIRAPHVQ